MKWILLALFVVMMSPALAQTVDESNPEFMKRLVDAAIAQRNNAMNDAVVTHAHLEQAQAALKAAQDRAKALEDKYETNPSAPEPAQRPNTATPK